MNPVFPYELHEDYPGFFISFPDVPGALTGDDTEEETRSGALNCLIEAMEGCMDLRGAIPLPSQPNVGQGTVILPPLVVAKLALYEGMRKQGMTRVTMARELGVTENVVRRLLDLRHRSHIGQVENALAVLGKRLMVTVQDAA
ncbi:MAG: hypothetical protein HQL07_14955 [Nitrospirae bacterium]|nr:hypothetical protein [Magnetococcales bacterium]